VEAERFTILVLKVHVAMVLLLTFKLIDSLPAVPRALTTIVVPPLLLVLVEV
jgi:hypothetical protein